MKFRRKSSDPVDSPVDSRADSPTHSIDDVAPEVSAVARGPHDADEVALDDSLGRVDLGSLVIVPVEGLEVQLQVDENTEEVQAAMLTGPDGALELRAFAAPRGGDLWSELRPKIAAEYAQRGGTATEREGRWGTELLCQVTVRTEDGRTATQPTRVIGVNGSRWMLRATLLGRPAVEVDDTALWESAIENVVVNRGGGAMPVGAQLPLVLPPRDRLVQRDD